ncbi:MAG: PKD domain-containing protein, partial [Desulfosalsimonadaceae bacterium]
MRHMSFMVPFLIRRFGFLLIFVLSCFSFSNDCRAYQAGTHTWIALQALQLVDNPDLQNQTYRDEITQGAWEADYTFYKEAEGTWASGYELAYRDHFYNPDTNEALCLCRILIPPCWTAKAKAEQYWRLAIDAYNIGNKVEAYKFLGHIGHLLADMAVPAHVLDDPHLPWNPDSYEDYMDKGNYTKWGFRDVSSEIRSANTLDDLFDDLAQHTQYFPSNDNLGNQENADPSWFIGWPENSSNMRVDALGNICGDGSVGCHIEDYNCEKIGGKLIPLAIEYSAALYNLFYEQFNVSISGPSEIPALYNGLDYCPLFMATGKINGLEPDHWEWDLNYDGTFEADPRYSGQPAISPDPLDFKTRGTKRIAVKAKVTAQAIEKTAEKTITVTQYPIHVGYPDGYEDLDREFSTPQNDLIETYSWNYGDGSPVEEGPSHGNTFPTSGYYNVTLTLTLDDNSTIQSETGIFVGPGTRYIQGHTIYGDETWYAGETYVVLGSIGVAQGGRLIIEPGVRVELNSGVSFSVSGTLTATGVSFTRADEVNEWGGIYFENTGASGSRLENCIIEHGAGTYSGIGSGVIKIYIASPTITGCTINNSNAENGISIQDATPTITGNSISGFPVGINL